MEHGSGWRSVAFDSVEALPWRHSELRWLPLRHALGTRIVGIGGYVADRPGQQVVEDHVESVDGRGHEELYLVMSGVARFTLDGVDLDAPAGTFVLVDDPAVRRGAVAMAAGTRVIAFGGQSRYEPAASEWIERARAYAADDPDRARAVVDDLRTAQPSSAAVLVAEAVVVAAAGGDRTAAAAALRGLFATRPDLRDRLAGDPDLAPLLGGVQASEDTGSDAGAAV